ncbi:MAG: hypothetical protein JSR73_08675 [Proteobacteria bacterium]|nr:hypothetical protein [Pseudomonadota bacterium]
MIRRAKLPASPVSHGVRRIARAVSNLFRLRAGPIQDVIESQIVPRLLIADSMSAPGLAGGGSWEPCDADVAELTRLLLEHDARVAGEYIDVLRAKGVTEAAVWLELVAPTARRLGDLASQPRADAARLERAQRELRALVGQLERARPPSFRFATSAARDG